ncbi:MAG: NAD(P)H-hydrate dehydratase [Myxococcaceae bacterium]
MRRAVTSEEMRRVESLAEAQGTSLHVLMERAGLAVAEAAVALAPSSGRFVVFCGPGNNGGDGFVAARILSQRGRDVRILEAAESRAPLAQAMREEVRQLPRITWDDLPAFGRNDVAIDALLGTGLGRMVEGTLARAVTAMATLRQSGARVLAVDVPSGLGSEAQGAAGLCVTADATIALGAYKVGHLLASGREHCGQTSLADIGLSGWVAELPGPGVFGIEEEGVRAMLPARRLDTHKGTFGHVLVVAGSEGKSGAASLCAEGVLRAGAGLCTVAARSDVLEEALPRVPEAMGWPLAHEGPLTLADAPSLQAALADKRAWVLGPGIGRGKETGPLFEMFLRSTTIPAVLDADALNALTKLEAVREAKGGLILTPHPGEAARLLEMTPAQVQVDRVAAARTLAVRSGAVVVLKGASTLVADPTGNLWVNPTGNPGMASGGMGDALAGMIGGFLAQGLPPLDAARIGVYAHGAAADIAAQQTGQLGLLARDVLASLGTVWTRWKR